MYGSERPSLTGNQILMAVATSAARTDANVTGTDCAAKDGGAVYLGNKVTLLQLVLSQQ